MNVPAAPEYNKIVLRTMLVLLISQYLDQVYSNLKCFSVAHASTINAIAFVIGFSCNSLDNFRGNSTTA